MVRLLIGLGLVLFFSARVSAQAPTIISYRSGASTSSAPASLGVAAGQSITLGVNVTGAAPISYQWSKGGSPISGATGATYTVASFSSGDAGSYTVFVSNSAGSVTSAAFTMTLRAGPATITQQPQSQSVPLGGTATFTIAATGYSDMVYTWAKSPGSIVVGHGATFTLSNAQLTDAGNYFAAVSSSSDPSIPIATSNTVSLTVEAVPSIFLQPSDLNLIEGGMSAHLSCTAIGTPGLSYEVRRNGIVVKSGLQAVSQPSITATYSPSLLDTWQTSDAGIYTFVITNAYGSTTSRAAVVTVGTQLRITTQPTGGPVAVGANETLSVTAVGNGTLSYQWKKNGNVIPGATLSSLILNNLTVPDGGVYTVVVTDSLGTLTSAQAIVDVFPIPVINLQPQSVTVNPSARVTFTVSAVAGASFASNVQQLSYRWYKNGVAIDDSGSRITGTRSSTLWIENTQTSDEGSYKVVISDTLSVVTSNTVTLTLNGSAVPPSIVIPPQSTSATAGSRVTLTVGASGSGPLVYDWNFVGSNGPVAVSHPDPLNPDLVIRGFSAADVGTYTVTVSNNFGSVSASATLSLAAAAVAPSISTQPASVTVSSGGTTSFSVVATGTGPLTYQWFKNSQAVAGAKFASLSFSSAQLSDAGSYYVVVTGPGGTAQSNSAALSVTASSGGGSPVIAVQPASQAVMTGSAFTFSVLATGTPAPSYQWYFNGAPLAGANGSSYSVNSSQPAQAGNYTVVVSTTAGSVTSATATLTVQTPAPASSLSGTFFGNLASGDSFGLYVRSDGTAVLIVAQPSARSALVANLRIGADGSFSGSGPTLSDHQPLALLLPGASESPTAVGANAVFSGTISAGGSISGSFNGSSLSGARTVGTSVQAGYYHVSVVNGDDGGIDLMVGADGRALLIAQKGSMLDFGSGGVALDGKLSLVTTGGVSLALTVDANNGMVTASAGSGPLAGQTISGVRDGIERTDRLANISTRANTGLGENAMIAGFVIVGDGPRPVLVRAVGASLSRLGLGGTLNDSRLSLFKGSSKIAESDDYVREADAAAIATLSAQLGAFDLLSDGKDAVLLTTLAPGSYTAQVSGANDSTGVALVEVYDAGIANGSSAPRLANISTRGRVGSGDSVLIAGIVVRGNVPKRVLVRAIGPTLSVLGVGQPLSDPVLKIYSGSNVLVENDDWGGTSAISNAAASVGAFALPTDSKDSSILITLAPGNYTAMVSGKGASTGVSLVEVYELP